MYESELVIARTATVEAGNMLVGLQKRDILSEEGKDIKLSADKMSERIILDSYLLCEEHGYDVLSEEKGFIQRNDHSHTWIVDPLDGSANYVRGMNELCCVSIALWRNDGSGNPIEPVLGVVNCFSSGRLYFGIVGEGAWVNGVPIHTSTVNDLGKAFLATGFPVFRDYSDESLIRFAKDVKRFKKIRMLGTAACMGTLVAEGKVDVYMEEGIMLWDIAGSTAILKGAGGEAEVLFLDQYKTICKLFANKVLANAYNER